MPTRLLWCIIFTVYVPMLQAHSGLLLDQAVKAALTNEPGLVSHQLEANALKEEQVAANTLPDPMVSIGAINVPDDTFDFDQENMTQLRFGVRQQFPRGNTLALQGDGLGIQSANQQVSAALRKLEIKRAVRLAWFSSWGSQQAVQLLKNDRYLFSQLIELSESLYSVGRKTQQDIYQAKLVLSRHDNRIIELKKQQQSSLAMLARWLPNQTVRRVANKLPHWSAVTRSIDPLLLKHPMVEMSNKQIDLADNKIALAKEAYKPQWGVELGYGLRQGDDATGNDRANFVSAMVTFDLPLFNENKQDKTLAANQIRRESATYQREMLIRKMRSRYLLLQSQITGINDSIALYQHRLIPEANLQAKAALESYQADRIDFATVIQAYISRLNVKLEMLKLKENRFKTLAQLRFFTEIPFANGS
ncbi:TolC family protein [Spartinivicinus poritis]|uniref:TolC family protein n=1 Tax=Spartinivicinus poritis TaxID=2994640 RepID=A0ABT5U3D7_9GAMM|nr:TolC family protein [Spartinivicinus sp. A2-2]MDE1460880.1 TolC family protein [Spartinivicinus sp. A2-2]